MSPHYPKPTHRQERIFKQVLDSSYKIHSNLGPGLLESAYETCLAYELKKQGLHVGRKNRCHSFMKK